MILAILILAIFCVVIYFINQNMKQVTSVQGEEINVELEVSKEYDQVEDGEETTQSDYVSFDAYFLRDLDEDGYAESIRGTCKEIGEEDTLYMDLRVSGNGYLENGQIEIIADNMYFKTSLVSDDVINGNYIDVNTSSISLNKVYAGTQKLIYGQVRSGDYRYTSTTRSAIGTDTNKLTGINKVILTGTHVAEDGTRTDIEKVVEFTVDWYG